MASKKNLDAGKGCLMLYLSPECLEIWKSIQSEINKDDINDEDGGLEDEPHVTLLYGYDIEKMNEDLMTSFMNDIPKGLILQSSKIDMFSNDRFDVLKFNIDLSDELKAYRNRAEIISPWSSDFPDYHPHATLAYLLPGQGAKYCKSLGPLSFEITSVVYSLPDGTKIERII